VRSLLELDQGKIPIMEAIRRYLAEDPVRMHMPGHKGGRGAAQVLLDLLGEAPFQADLTEVPGLDDLHQAKGPIGQAQKLAAEAFGAAETFFLVNGASAGIHGALLALAAPGDKVFLPRHMHRSVFTALVLTGVEPVYLLPFYHRELAMPLAVPQDDWAACWDRHSRGKIAFFVSPTYEGVASLDRKLIQQARAKGLITVVDEAHGPHFSFHPLLPSSALRCGADLVIHGSHKLLSAFTQAAMLHLNRGLDREKIREALRLLQTTSPSYLLLLSLDVARFQMAGQGEILLDELLEIAGQARREINRIKGFRCWGRELLSEAGVTGLDQTKLIIDGLELGFDGFSLAASLRRDYRVQVEMAAPYYILALLSIGDKRDKVDHLIRALRDLSGRKETFAGKEFLPFDQLKAFVPTRLPELVVSPRESFFRPKRSLPLEEAVGAICGELLVPYPPGIPFLCPGERISEEMVERLQELRRLPINWQGAAHPALERVQVLEE
jgi:arginine decarboxylase